MRILLSMVFLVCLVSSAQAAYVVCGNANDGTALTDGFRTHRMNVSPTTKPADCYVVPEAQIAAQQTLVQTTDHRKLKIDTANNVVVLKSTSSQAAIDAADAAAAALDQGYVTEQQTDNLCSETDLSVIDSKVDTLMATVVDLASAKSAMTVAVKKLARCLISFRELAR